MPLRPRLKQRRESQFVEVPETREEVRDAEINATIKEMLYRMGIAEPKVKKEIAKHLK